jgi:hypothetical protein
MNAVRDAGHVASVEQAMLDASLEDADWPVIQRLWRAGVSNAAIYRLLRLRLAVHAREHPSVDGMAADPRARFARWLVTQGRLSES